MFLMLIFVLSIFLLLLIFVSMRNLSKEKTNQTELHNKLNEVSIQVEQKNEALKEEIGRKKEMEEELKNVKAKLETQNKEIKVKVCAEIELRKVIDRLTADVAVKDKQLKDNLELLDRKSIEISNLKEVVKKKEAELVSLGEAYNGLKEQYDDLERAVPKGF